jgi:glycosyltransferase involved in cell wall biosynthesis
VLTEHQVHTLLALIELTNTTLIVYVTNVQDKDRSAQGWTAVKQDFAGMEIQVVPRRLSLFFIARRLWLHRGSTHIFGSPFDKPQFIVALFLATLLGQRPFLISEPYSPISAGSFSDRMSFIGVLKANLRPLLYKIYGAVLSRRLEGVFAISPLSVVQYRAMGVPPNRIFPFGYFVPLQQFGMTNPHRIRNPGALGLRAICVASLIKRKGIGYLIAAVTRINANGVGVQVDVFGPGDPAKFGFRNTEVQYRGVIPFGRAQEIIARYDLLVLPSKYDGWGVVINEALMAGVPVVCSDGVGAAAVVRKWGCGSVYALSDPNGLELCLTDLAINPSKLVRMRRQAIEVGRTLEPMVAAKYMLTAMQGIERRSVPPECPWFDAG